jgi:thiol:disulfide interchange protein DsbD
MRYLFTLLMLLPLFAHAADGELLEPEEAFKFSARVIDQNNLEVRYQIADGYYLYRNKFKFAVQPAGVTLGTPQTPQPQVKQDEFFGRVEIYHNEVKIKLPIKRTDGSIQNITLKSTAQGCAEAGVCYPPVEQTATLKLAAASTTTPPAPPASAPTGLSALKQLGADLGGTADEFLPPDLAFKLRVSAKDANTLIAEFSPAASYYLYRDKIKFSLQDSAGTTISKVGFPQGEIKTDPTFGKTEVFHNAFKATIELKRAPEAAGKITLAASYQGCSEKGVCYPPINKTFNISLPAGTTANAAADTSVTDGAAPPPEAATQATAPAGEVAGEIASVATPAAPADQSESSKIERLFKGGNFWLIVAFFFGAGLLLALTPCVFPMIPILSGIIAGQGQHLTKSRAFVLSLSYVLGMAITYSIAGVAAGLSGTLLSAALQNPWVLGTFALVFVALSFSMFGFYELQLPNFIQSKFSDASNKMKGGSVTGVFIMGALSAVIVGPCVAAPLAGALLYIGQTNNVFLGGSALFAMALGMGVPLILVGVSAGALMPKAGGWMNAVKSFFGVLLLGVAIWLISPVIPDVVNMLLWAALLIVSGIYLRALDSLPPTAHGFARFWKGVGIISLIYGAALLIGVLAGGRDVLQPLAGLRAAAGASGAAAGQVEAIHFERIKSIAELDRRITAAKGKYVMVDFYADWCVSCKEFERFTFSDYRVKDKLKDVVLLQVDVTANSADDTALLKRFKLFGPPGIIFFDKNGNEVSSARTIGYTPPDKFLATLDKAFP